MEHFGTVAELDWSDAGQVAAFLLEIERLCAGSAYAFDMARPLGRVEGIPARSPRCASTSDRGQLRVRGDWTGRLRMIEQPVLVIHREEDLILPLANGEAPAAGIPNAERPVPRGTGRELPALALSEIADQIARLAGSFAAPKAAPERSSRGPRHRARPLDLRGRPRRSRRSPRAAEGHERRAVGPGGGSSSTRQPASISALRCAATLICRKDRRSRSVSA